VAFAGEIVEYELRHSGWGNQTRMVSSLKERDFHDDSYICNEWLLLVTCSDLMLINPMQCAETRRGL